MCMEEIQISTPSFMLLKGDSSNISNSLQGVNAWLAFPLWTYCPYCLPRTSGGQAGSKNQVGNASRAFKPSRKLYISTTYYSPPPTEMRVVTFHYVIDPSFNFQRVCAEAYVGIRTVVSTTISNTDTYCGGKLNSISGSKLSGRITGKFPHFSLLLIEYTLHSK